MALALNQETTREELRTLVQAWRDKVPARSKPVLRLVSTRPAFPAWQDFLKDLGYDATQHGWAGDLVRDASAVKALDKYLDTLSDETWEQLAEAVCEGVKWELEHFALGLAENPSSERFEFVLQSARLQELYNAVNADDISLEIEDAFNRFDRELETRRQKLQARISWKPNDKLTRVDPNVRARDYKPGRPHWLSGRLNDAPMMLGRKLTLEEAERTAIALEKSLFQYLGKSDVPRPRVTDITTQNTYFAQGQEPRVQFGQVDGAPGVEGYLKKAPDDGARVLEFPLEDGRFAYLMFDGHHRSAAQLMRGLKKFRKVTVMRLDDVEKTFGLNREEIVDAIRDLHTHLFMTDRPVPK